MDTRRSVVGICAPILAAAIGLAGRAHAQIAGDSVNMVSGIQWPGGDPYLQRQNEPTLAVSSVNPQHLMAGANDYRSVDVPDPAFGRMIAGDSWMGVFKSVDGGQTWKSVLLPGYPQECEAVARANAPENARRAALDPPLPPLPLNPLCGYPATADPVMRAGTDGLFYLAGINFQRDKSASRLFVARFIDDNNKENGSATGDPAKWDPANPTRFTPTDPLRYIDTVEVWSSERNKAANPSAPLAFMDKPWIAVDVPRANVSCTLRTASGASILAGTVYMAWAQFYQTGVKGTDDYQSDIMISWSTDCGSKWSTPMKLNTVNSIANQGASIAIEPVTGRVYVTWRRGRWPADPTLAAKQTDAIMVTRSAGRQRTFAAPRAIAKIIPFDLATDDGQARTQTMPSMAIASDGKNSWGHVAWASRVAADGESRVHVATARIHPPPSGDGDQDDPEEQDAETRVAWTTPVLADPAPLTDDVGNTFTRGHQYMPSLTFGQGRLMLLYYDTRLDHTVRYYRPLAPVDGTWPGGRFYQEELAPAGDLLDPYGSAAVFNSQLWDYSTPPGGRPHAWRHTIEVRVSSLPWGASAAAGGTLVSRFPFGIRGDEANPGHADPPPPLPEGGITASGFVNGAVYPGKLGVVDGSGLLLREQQLQMNVPGFPMFKGGTVAFMGDYIDLQGPAFVPRQGGWWDFNLAPTPSPVFHAVWTSNQDVRTPPNDAWTSYTPVTGLAGPTVLFDGGRVGPDQTPVIRCDAGSVGSRDQNIYTSRITEGLHVSSAQNVKPLVAGAMTTFVLAARNETPSAMSVRIAASAASPVTVPPPASATVDYSFTPILSPGLTSLCATIAPRGSVTRTLFAQLKGFGLASVPLYVQVDEVASCAPGAATTGRSASLTLNPPVAFNSLVQPDGASLPPLGQGEVYTLVTAGAALGSPTMGNPTMGNPTMGNPTMGNPTMGNPTMGNPTMGNPTMGNPTMGNLTLTNPTMGNPTMGNPTMGNTGVASMSLTNPTMGNPTMGNAGVSDGPWDWSQTITNTGNTTTSYHVKVVGTDVDATKPLQLVLSKTYYTNGAQGCELRLVPHDQVFVSVPDVQRSIVAPTDQVDPGASDPRISNATLSLAPGESAAITLRGFMSLAQMAQTVGRVQTAPLPAAVTPAPNVTYQNYAVLTGRPPLLRPTPIVTVSSPGPGAVTAQVSPDPTWSIPPSQPITGAVTFVRNGGEILGTVTLTTSGQARTGATLAAGDTVTALYGGDATYAPASGTFVQPAPVSAITITPGYALLTPGGTIAFTATGPGTIGGVTWSVVEGAAGGAINAAGLYTAPLTFGTWHVVATSVADPTVIATAVVSTGAYAGSLATPRALNAAASVGCNLFTFGGTQTGSEALASIEWWNVCLNANWSAAGSLLAPRSGAATTVALSPDGSRYLVYVIGGRSGGPAAAGSALATVEAYDWQAGTSAFVSPLNVARQNLTAATVTVGGRTYVYAIGGSDGTGALATVERLDTSNPNGGWELLGPRLATARELHAGAVVNVNGRDVVYAIGGRGASALDTVELLDPVSGTWTAGPRLPIALQGAGATAVGSWVYVIGGSNAGFTIQPTIWRLDGAGWTAAATLGFGRAHPGVTSINGDIFIIGGNLGNGWNDTGVTQGFFRP
jgi:hypothetical protein